MYDPLGKLTDTDHYLVIAKVRKRLLARKEPLQKFDVERLNLNKVG
jgi:hypothetical protein